MRLIIYVISMLMVFTFNGCAMCAPPCKDGESIFSGEFPLECLKYITIEPSEGMDKGKALKLSPDPWHKPTLKFHCGKQSRKDFASFTELQFYFRCPASNPGNPTIQLKTWNQSSRVVSIRDHISAGTIDNTYRLVKIPLSSFKTPDWDLGNVESLEWGIDPDRRTYFVDMMKLNQTTVPSIITDGEWAPFAETNNILRLTFTNRWQEQSIRNLNNYTIYSVTDPSYHTPLHPVDIGLTFRVFGFSPSKVPYIRYSIFIRLPKPLRNGFSYTLGVSGVKDEFCNQMHSIDIPLNYNDKTIITPNIKINQEGYLPEALKIGYVGGYLGDLGGGAWAVGQAGALFQWKIDHGWKKISVPTKKSLRSIAGLREDNLYCVGDGGDILHWNGETFLKDESPTTNDLLSISFGPTGIGWAVGNDGVTIRNSDGIWKPVASPASGALNGVWAGPDDAAWAVGDNGVILKWNGSNWENEDSTTKVNLYAIGSGGDSGQLWAVGDNGTILVRSHGKWKSFSATLSIQSPLRCVSVDPGGGVWIGGDKGILIHKAGTSSEFKLVDSHTNTPIYGLTRQNSRRLWAVGPKGLLISYSSDFTKWNSEKNLGTEDLFGLFSIPYGALRLPKELPDVSIYNMETGEIALTIPLKLEFANWSLSGEDVYSFDFSAIKSSGVYQAYVPGVGVSTPIRVSDSALNKAAYTSAHAFYYQRCGTTLTEPYAEKDFTRPLDHEYDVTGRKIDAAFHESLPRTPLHSGEKPGVMINAQGGWHDAGDYGKYMPTAAAALWYLFTAYDIQQSKFQDGTWNIPESGNGVPDLLDEARWELDWMVRIQADDGGVYHKQTSERWYHGMPQDDDKPRFLYEKTTHDTALAAAVLASAARLWKVYDPELSHLYLSRAEKAWAFIERHPVAVPQGGFHNPPKNVTGEYSDKEDIDNRLWAATELYRTTGLQKYKDYFETWWRKNKSHPWGWNTWQDFYRCAYWAYLNSDKPDADPKIRREIKRGLIEKANKVIDLTNSNPYRNGARLNVPEWIGWGAFTQSSEYSFLLLQAWKVTSDKKYLDMALLNVDTQLGANPLSMSFITGLGSRSPKDPLHLPSMYDAVVKPVPGLPIFGPAAHLPNNQPYYVACQHDSNSYPQSRETLDPYPILRRYIDANQLVPMSEFTIVELAACAATLNILAQKPEKN